MTEKLYYDDPYICEAEGNINEITQKDNKYIVVLDKTPFYPEGGGQPNDLGTIDNIKVEYVYEEEDTIYHVLSEKPLNIHVKCKVDFERRRDHIQQHSGEHLLSAAFFKLYKGVNAGFHMGEEYVTIDIDMRDLTEEMIKKAELEANSYLYRNEEVKTYFLTKEEALKLPLRKEIKANGIIRIVQMGNMDYSACCGTQVRRTGEVGIIKILKSEKYKSMTRIYFVCGERALKDYIRKQYILTELGRSLSTDENGIIKIVKNQNDEILNLKKQLIDLNLSLSKVEAKELIKNSGDKYIVKLYENKNFEYVQNLYEYLKDEGLVIIIGSLIDKKLLYAHNGSLAVDCGKTFKEMLKQYEGKGGGNPKRAQAAFDSEEKMIKFAEYLAEIKIKG